MAHMLYKFLKGSETFTNKHGVTFGAGDLETYVRDGLAIASKHKIHGVGLEICTAVLLYANHYNPKFGDNEFLTYLFYQQVKQKRLRDWQIKEICYADHAIAKLLAKAEIELGHVEYQPETISYKLPTAMQKVARLLMAGESMEEVAEIMKVSVRTLSRWRIRLEKEVA